MQPRACSKVDGLRLIVRVGQGEFVSDLYENVVDDAQLVKVLQLVAQVHLTGEEREWAIEVAAMTADAFVARGETIGFAVYGCIQSSLTDQGRIGLLFIPLVTVAFPVLIIVKDLRLYLPSVFVNGFGQDHILRIVILHDGKSTPPSGTTALNPTTG